MNCRDFVDFIMSYLEDELPGGQKGVFEQHMVDCPDCETFLDTYRQTVRLGSSLCNDPEGPLPEDAPEDLIEAVLAARTRS